MSVSRTVSETFGVRKWCSLEIWVRVVQAHWKWYHSKVWVSYSHCEVTMALSCIIFEINQDIGRKSPFFIPPAFDTPLGGSPSQYWNTVWCEKNYRMVWLPEGGKKFDDTFSRFDRIPACDRRTDGRTDRQTDGQTSCDIIVRAVAR